MNSTSKTINKILYVLAMEEESSVLLEKRKFTLDDTLSSEYSNILESYVSTENESKIIIIRPKKDPLNQTGLFGTEISFFLTYIGLKHYSPDVVISMGYAGDTGVDVGIGRLSLGSVVIAKEKGTYHRRNMIIEFFQKTSEGNYPVLDCNKMCNELNFYSCYVGTSNSFVVHDEIAYNKNIKVVEMELCSVARACAYFDVGCIGVKIISDKPNENLDKEEREKEFLRNLIVLRQSFYDTFEKLNLFILNKTKEDL